MGFGNISKKIYVNNLNSVITFKAKCKYCAHLLSVASVGDTSHLKRHANKHLQSQQPDIRNQIQLGLHQLVICKHFHMILNVHKIL